MDTSSIRKKPIDFLIENYPQFFTPAAQQPSPLTEMDRLLGLSPEQCPLLLQEPLAIPAALDCAIARA